MSCFLLSAVAAALAVPTPDPTRPAQPVTRLFCVYDLVAPLPTPALPGTAARLGFAIPPNEGTSRATGDRLVRLVSGVVRPYSWAAAGGAGEIDYYDTGYALVVTATPAVVREVAGLLSALRTARPAGPAADVCSSQFRLRNVAAADAAQALVDYHTANRTNLKVIAEPVSNTVLVSGPAEPVRRAVAMLEALDRNPTLVVVEVRYLRVPLGFCASLGLKPTGDGVAPLTENEVRTLHETAHGCKECQVLQAPKLCLFDNQPGTVDDTTRHTFVTGVEAQNVNGEVVFVPQNKAVTVGDTLTVCGRVSPDERSVNLRLNLHRSRIVGEVPLAPVVTQFTPVFEGGSRGKPVPFTQFVQAPRVHTTSVERTLMLPTGGTAVVGVWTEPAEDAAAGKTGAGLATLLKPAAPPKRVECEVIMLATVHVVRD